MAPGDGDDAASDDDHRDPAASDAGKTDPGARKPKRGTSGIMERGDAVFDQPAPVRDANDTKSGATIADTPRTRGQANLAALPTRFTVKSTLGEGGMGTVVEAYDRALGRDVAIKVLATDAHGDQSVGARFVREARAAAQLRHPGIVQVHDIDPDGEYIVMELVRGESLSTRLRREGKLTPSEVRRIGGALLEALGVAHEAGIVHRDVKPANVLLGEHGEVKLSDFGVAFFGDSDLTMPGTRIGTPAYMAPEQLRARHVDARADVYAAGATLFEAATGKRMHDDDVLPKDLATVVRDATGDAVLATAIAKAVRERPVDRFSDGAAFAKALDGPTVTEVAGKPIGVPARRQTWVAGLAALAVAGGTLAYALRGSTDGGNRPPDVTPVANDARVGPRVVALLPFADATKNPLLDFASSGLPNLLGLELHEVPGVNVVGYYQLLGHLKGPEEPVDAWRAVAAKLDASVVVRGELTAAGDRIHVMIRIETPAGMPIDVVERDAKIEEVPEVVRGAAGQVATAALGKRLAGSARTATSFDADRELQLGIADLERERLPEAVTHLRAAVHHAPDLKLAHYYLAVALYWSAPPAGPAREEIDRALALGLDEAQRGFLGGLRRIVDQDYKQGIDQLLPLTEKFPANKDILYALFEALFHGGRPSEAMAIYHRLITLQPAFRLALIHAFTFYVAHGDESGTSWALALGDPAGDAYNRIWEPKIMIAHREYKPAIKLLSEKIDSDNNSGDLQGELMTAYLLDEQLDLAVALIGKFGKGNAASTAAPQLALATVHGDAGARAKWRAVQLRDIGTQAVGAARTILLTQSAVAEIPVASKPELLEFEKLIDESIVADYARSLNLNIAQALIATALGDDVKIAQFATSPYPEVSGLATAAIARKQKDYQTAITAVRRAIASSGDARFMIHEYFVLAQDLRAAGDHAGVVAACDEVIRPRLFSWEWGTTVIPCLQWTAEADEALGKRVEARAAWNRIMTLRTAAPASDPAVRAARAGVARLK